MRIPFSQERYDKYDKAAKTIAALYLQSIGHTVKIPTEDFGIDLYSETKYGKTLLHEVEVKVMWKGEFVFDTVKFLVSKNKPHLSVIYWIISKDLKQAFLIKNSQFKDEYKNYESNKYSNKEWYYYMPKKLCKYIKLPRV